MFKKALATFKSVILFFPILTFSRRQNNVKMHLCVMALSGLDELDLIIGKGLGVRILAFETRS